VSFQTFLHNRATNLELVGAVHMFPITPCPSRVSTRKQEPQVAYIDFMQVTAFKGELPTPAPTAPVTPLVEPSVGFLTATLGNNYNRVATHSSLVLKAFFAVSTTTRVHVGPTLFPLVITQIYTPTSLLS